MWCDAILCEHTIILAFMLSPAGLRRGIGTSGSDCLERGNEEEVKVLSLGPNPAQIKLTQNYVLSRSSPAFLCVDITLTFVHKYATIYVAS